MTTGTTTHRAALIRIAVRRGRSARHAIVIGRAPMPLSNPRTLQKSCKDCGSTTRALPHPGPRCATCWRAERKRRSLVAHERRVTDVYGLEPGDYAKLYEAQGGTCAIERCRAKGLSRRLAVEHDHRIEHLGRESVRGLVCAVHNEWIGRAGDDPEIFESIANYLRNPPARAILAPHCTTPSSMETP